MILSYSTFLHFQNRQNIHFFAFFILINVFSSDNLLFFDECCLKMTKIVNQVNFLTFFLFVHIFDKFIQYFYPVLANNKTRIAESFTLFRRYFLVCYTKKNACTKLQYMDNCLMNLNSLEDFYEII